MAKKKTETRKFSIVDLVRKKPKSDYIVIPKYRVDVEIEVTTKGVLKAPDVPPALLDRLEKTARDKLDDYERIIAQEAAYLDVKIAGLMKTPSEANLKQAESLIQGVNASIKNALASAEPAAKAAVEARLKKEAQGDKNLKEARVRTGIKWTLGVISIGGNAAKAVASMGADVSSYIAIAKTLASLGADLVQQLKNEAKLRADLNKAVQAHIDFRATAISEAARKQNITDLSGLNYKEPKKAIAGVIAKIKAAKDEILDGKDKATVAKNFLDLVVKGVKSKLADVEKARKAYREHTTKTRQKTDKLSLEAGKLQAAMKAAKNLKEGVKVGAECMTVKRSVSAMAAKLETRETYLDGMQDIMKSNGLEVDDRTTIDKLKDLDKTTILTEGKAAVDAIKGVKEAISQIAKVAA